MNSKYTNFVANVLATLIVSAIAYAFLSLCNWDLNAGHWNGFSRFVFGVASFGTAMKVFLD
jgi:hypothetical protein